MIHEVPETLLFLINQLHELQQKTQKLEEGEKLRRNFDRIQRRLQADGYEIEIPLGAPYSETRTDCEAHISGDSAENLVIVEVVKPIVRLRSEGMPVLVQRGVVIVESR